METYVGMYPSSLKGEPSNGAERVDHKTGKRGVERGLQDAEGTQNWGAP